MDLQKQINNSMAAIVKSGKIEQMIEAQLTKTIQGIVEDTLRSYSDFGKMLKEKMEAALQLDFDRLSLTEYNAVIIEVVQNEFNKSAIDYSTEMLRKQISKFVSPLEESEWKLSTIVKKVIEMVMDDDREEEDGEISLHISESQYGSIHIYIDPESGKRKFECRYQIDISSDTGEIYSFEAKDDFGRKINPKMLRGSYHDDIAKMFFRLYASGVHIEIDRENCETEWWKEERYY